MIRTYLLFLKQLGQHSRIPNNLLVSQFPIILDRFQDRIHLPYFPVITGKRQYFPHIITLVQKIRVQYFRTDIIIQSLGTVHSPMYTIFTLSTIKSHIMFHGIQSHRQPQLTSRIQIIVITGKILYEFRLHSPILNKMNHIIMHWRVAQFIVTQLCNIFSRVNQMCQLVNEIPKKDKYSCLVRHAQSQQF